MRSRSTKSTESWAANHLAWAFLCTLGITSAVDHGLLSAAASEPASVVYFVQPPDEQEPPAEESPLAELEQLLQTPVVVPALQQEVSTVSRQQSTVGKSPAAVFVITNDMIRRSGATTIPELFRMVPGMDVARIDNNKWSVSARGFNERFSRFLLVQIDGRAVYNPIFSGVYWDAVDYPLQDIERIEVIRGPGATVWGANAVNGVINIITKSAKDTQGALASTGGGNVEQGFGTFRYGGRINDDLYYRVYGKGFNRSDQFAPFDDPNDQWHGGSTGLRMDWQASDCDAVMLDAGYLRSVAGRNDSRPFPSSLTVPPFTFRNLEEEISNNSHVLCRWSHTQDTDSGWALQAYWDGFQRHSTNGYVDFRWDTYDIDFQQHFLLGDRHHIVYGLGYRFVDARLGLSANDGGFALDFSPSHRQTHLPSAFIQDQIDIVEDTFAVILGTKLEVNSFTGFQVQPTGRILWTPSERQTAWAAVSRALRTPNLNNDRVEIKGLPVDLGGGNVVFPALRGNTAFDNEELLAYEIGYRAAPTDEFSWDVALFYNVYNDIQATRGLPVEPGPAPMTFILPQMHANGLNGETYGVEVGGNWQLAEWWRLYAQYTFLQLLLHRDTGIDPAQEAIEGQSPNNQVYVWSSWDLGCNWEFDLIGRYVDKLSGFNPSDPASVEFPNTIPAYIALDARLAWRPCPHREIAIVGQNLTDNHHPENGTSAILLSPLIEIRRSVYAMVTVEW